MENSQTIPDNREVDLFGKMVVSSTSEPLDQQEFDPDQGRLMLFAEEPDN